MVYSSIVKYLVGAEFLLKANIVKDAKENTQINVSPKFNQQRVPLNFNASRLINSPASPLRMNTLSEDYMQEHNEDCPLQFNPLQDGGCVDIGDSQTGFLPKGLVTPERLNGMHVLNPVQTQEGTNAGNTGFHRMSENTPTGQNRTPCRDCNILRNEGGSPSLSYRSSQTDTSLEGSPLVDVTPNPINYTIALTTEEATDIQSNMKKYLYEYIEKQKKEWENKEDWEPRTRRSVRRSFMTACAAYNETTGKCYFGRNKGLLHKIKNLSNTINGTLASLLPVKTLVQFQNESNVPEQDPCNCAEDDAINQALEDNSKIGDLSIMVVSAVKTDRNKPACKNCTFAFKDRVARNYSGWSELTEDDYKKAGGEKQEE